MLFALKEKGQGLVEYALIIILIALVVIAGVTLFGTGLNSTFEMITNNISDLIP